MAKKKFDFKKLMMEKGEKIGLGAAAFIAFLLLVMYLFVGGGLFAEDPQERAKKLKQHASSVQSRLQTAQPDATDLPAPEKLQGETRQFEFARLTDSDPYRVGELFAARTSADTGRRQPDLLLPTEGTATVVLSQLRSFIFDRDWKQVAVLKASRDLKGQALPGSRAGDLARFFGGGNSGGGTGLGNFAPGAAGMGDAGMGDGGGGTGGAAGGLPGYGPPSGGVAGDFSGAQLKIEYYPVTELKSVSSARLAETVRPLRQAIIVASFPYEKQLEEFKAQLRLPSKQAVLSEYSADIDPDTRQPLPSFRFLGVELQRRVVDANGKPLPGEDWKDVNVVDAFKPYIALSGFRQEPATPELNAISFDGLVMPRLLQMRPGQYPDLAMKLPSIESALDELKNKDADQVKPKSPFDAKDYNPFARRNGGNASVYGASGLQSGYGAGSPEGMGDIGDGGGGTGAPPPPPGYPGSGDPMPGFGKPGGIGMPGMPGSEGQVGREIKPPSSCLVRVIDVTVRPGTVYQYRLRVRMANPNYKRRQDVASPAYATKPELEIKSEQKWFEIPTLVHVPPETEYYAVDQRELEGSKYEGMNYNRTVPLNHVALQIQKWMENVADSERSFLPVGEWVVAERVFVARGEHIGQKMRMSIPVWMETRERFVVPSKKIERRNRPPRFEPTLVVDFASPRNESVLVDFQDGDDSYTRQVGGNEIDVRDSPDTRTEVLIFSSEGKLIAKNSVDDAVDEKRIERLDTYRERIEEVKKNEMSGGTPMGGEGGNPFGGGSNPFDCDE